MSEAPTDSHSTWGLLGLAGALGLCCLGTVALAGGATIVGSSAAGATAVSGVIGGLGGFLATGLATAFLLVVIGLLLRRRTH